MTIRAASIIAVLGLLLLAMAPMAQASYVTLTDNGSSITISDGQSGQVGGANAGKGPANQLGGPMAGAYNWDYNGADWLSQEWYDYEISGVTNSISSLTTTAFKAPYNTDLNNLSDNNATALQMTDPGKFSITITYQLTSNSDSDLGESVTIKNLSGNQLNMSLFEFNAWDLGGLTTGQTATFLSPNTYQQDGPVWTTLHGTKTAAYWNPGKQPGLTGFEHEAGGAIPLNTCILASNCAAQGKLNNGIVGNPGLQTYSGSDPAWAFEWDLTLNAGQSVTWSQDKVIGGAVLEPMPLILLGSLLVFIGRKLQVRILG